MSHKTTYKQVQQALKNTRHQLCVYSFDPFGTKKRVATYSCIDFLKAFTEITRRLAEGRLVVITNTESGDILNKIEVRENRRIMYDEAYPHSIVFFSNQEELDTIKKHLDGPFR